MLNVHGRSPYFSIGGNDPPSYRYYTISKVGLQGEDEGLFLPDCSYLPPPCASFFTEERGDGVRAKLSEGVSVA
ncbi:MAG: hypothetical protein ACI4WV_04370, partial [Eubacteriales bacterium]